MNIINIEILLSAIPCLTPPPGAGAVGDEESEKASDKQAFKYLFAWNTFHQPAFGEIEEEKAENSTCGNGRHSRFKPGGMNGTRDPASLWFEVQLFELHICRYVDKKICKSNNFSRTFTRNSGCLNSTG